MDSNHFIQEFDNPASYDTPPTLGCSELEEFQSLSHLANEFSIMDCSLFPFYVLGDSDLRSEIYGCRQLRPYNRSVRGNYVSGYILRDLRIQSRKITQIYPDLRFIFDLPPELVFEIFEHLHPIDLYSLIRTSKSLRSLLLRRQAAAVWKETFNRHPDIPSCPPNLSLPQWASLLFGPSICDDCGFTEAMPDFSFQKRKCDDCMGATLEFSDHFQHFEDEDILLTLVTRTHRFDAMSYPSSSNHIYNTRYSINDVNAMAAQMKQYLAAIDSNQPNAQEAYDMFKAETAKAVDSMMENVQVCNTWCSSFYKLLDIEVSEKIPHTSQKIQKRLVKLGYNPKDVEVLKDDDMFLMLSELNFRKFNNNSFRSFLPILEIVLREAKCTRLLFEREELISQRKKEVTMIYKDCQRRLDPALWQYLPEPKHFFQIDTISHYIYTHEQSPILDSYETAQMILSFFEQWLAYGKRGLLELISKHHTPFVLRATALDLAASVFICPSHSPNQNYGNSCSVLLGWEDAAVHLECNMPPKLQQLSSYSPELLSFEYSAIGHNTALSLLLLLGLEASTLAVDVEALEARFVCASCPLELGRRGSKGRSALKFKECVSHAVSIPDHPTDSFLLLSKEATESVIFHESSSCRDGELSWCCKHCSAQLDSYISRSSVIRHIQEMHSISEPVQRVDFVYQQHISPPHRKPYFVGIDVPRIYRCKNCPRPRSPRLWQMRSLLAHLKDGHDVSEPVQDVDWCEIDLWKSD